MSVCIPGRIVHLGAHFERSLQIVFLHQSQHPHMKQRLTVCYSRLNYCDFEWVDSEALLTSGGSGEGLLASGGELLWLASAS